METQSKRAPFGIINLSAALFALMVFSLIGTFAEAAAPLTINVVGVKADGTTEPVTSYRWTVEEDATKPSIPGVAATKENYSFSFHTSYMPVVAAGRAGDANGTPATSDPDLLRLYSQPLPSLDPGKRYFVSIANNEYQMGGAPVVFSSDGTTATATVYVNKGPVPSAQLSVFAFEDNSPINGAPDLPQEQGLAGFTVQLFEAGGTYGQSGGAVTQDGFGNPLGTTYNADGSMKVKGAGIVLTGADGTAVIKNLFPAKYTVVISPPVGSDWHQTSTIEGTRGSDAWVKNNEPTFFQEFGPPGHHVFIGFTRSGKITNSNSTVVLNGTHKIKGRVVNTHNSRPPVYTFYAAAPVNECWVGLNEANAGPALYAAPCNKDSTFTIPDVPAGTYELVVWDDPLDMIIATTTVTVGGSDLVLGDVPVSSWFARYQGRVFQDIDGTGLPFFAGDFNRPYIEVDPKTGLETEVTKTYKAGDLKPPFGEGIGNNIRFRDGSIYQSVVTKKDGTFAFTELFPFFNWMIAEIDYARFKATSMTAVVDNGGCVKLKASDCPADPQTNEQKLWKAEKGFYGSNDEALKYSPFDRLNPQKQDDGTYFRTESVSENPGGTGAVLLEGMQTFLGETNHIEWGKAPYAFNENGGIAGIVHYAITRAEDDPRYATAENWEPGIPRVQVNLYLDCDGDGIPDKPNNDGTGQCSQLSSAGYHYVKPDVDNYPFCWRDPESCGLSSPQKGPEDYSRGVTSAAFNYGDVFRWGVPAAAGDPPNVPADQTFIGLGKTDAWDDSLPTGCPIDPAVGGPFRVPTTGEALDCYDGLRNFNQVRPAVFDGGYAFGRVAGQAELPMFIGEKGAGTYIVEAVAPPGYLHQGNGDKNVVFGDALMPSPTALPFECVGQELDVPAELTLFPGEANPNFDNPQYPGNKWRKCDMKAVPLVPGTNPAPDFFMFTEAPVAGHGVGFILDDTATEFNQFAPTFGEKYSPPHLPVSVQDWTGREIARVYSDQFGSYNFLVPSSFTINPPFPSGVMPSMMVACMNHPGPIPDVNNPGKLVIDPYFNRNYTQFCYTLQYLAGKTTYLDTPVLPISAFASVDKNPLDCECANGTPAIYSATNGDNGPWVPAGGGSLTIVSQGKVDVVNPAYDPYVLWPAPPSLPSGYSGATGANDIRLKKTIQRDYGFGAVPGTVTVGGISLTNVTWSDGVITATVPAGASTGQLTIKRGGLNGKESVVGLTVHVGGQSPKKVNLAGTNGAYKTIQEAIDSVTDGDVLLGTLGKTLITVAPGTYNEYVIMDKRVRLQGWGAGSTTINAAKSSAGGLAAWRVLLNKKIDARCGTATGSKDIANCPPGTPIDPDTGAPTVVAGIARTFDPLPGQTLGINASNNEPVLFGAEEGAGVLVVGRQGLLNGLLGECLFGTTAMKIDGLSITGSDAGGGILASGYACGLEVSNNRVVANYGTYGGGVRIGHTALTTVVVNANGVEQVVSTDGVNRLPNIHHNWIAQNGATEEGGGGGITLGTGSNSYIVDRNYVCGNFSMADGGGMSHLGLSTGSISGSSPTANRISNNTFVFNQTFNQSADPMGGGLSIAGQVPVGGGTADGTGDVLVDSNLFQGNQAGAGAGGGVSIARTTRTNNSTGDDINLTNNMIVNNVAAYAGGGVALTDAAGFTRLVNNTVASNVSTATNRQSFGPQGPIQPSVAKVAGLAVLSGTSPTLLNNIIWGNRSYVYVISGTTTGLFNPGTMLSAQGVITPNATAQYRDLGRIAGNGNLAPVNTVLTTGGNNDHVTASATNIFEPSTSTTLFVKNNHFDSISDPNQPVWLADATVNLQSALTFDETGNFINVVFSPLTLWEIAGANIGSVRADYHLTTASVAKDKGQARVTGNNANFVPLTDFDADTRTAPVDIGADEQVAPPVTIHIADLDWTAATVDGTRWRASVTIAVHNAAEQVVSGAVVTGTWSAGDTNNQQLTCTTTAAGTCTVTSGRVTALLNKTVQFTVTSVTAAGSSYLSSANHDPDSGVQASNGTSITASPTFFVHVGDLDQSSVNTSGTQWSATVTVAVHDAVHAPVAGAQVSFTWLSNGNGAGSCTTNASGTCSVTRTGISRLLFGSAVATVSSVTSAGNYYTFGDNHDPDAAPQNSTGTVISVPRP